MSDDDGSGKKNKEKLNFLVSLFCFYIKCREKSFKCDSLFHFVFKVKREKF